MSALGTSIDRLRAELAANPRLRAGVWTIVAILLGYGVFVPHAERVERSAAEYAATDGRLVRARDLLAREDWQQRLDAATAIEAELAGRFWHAANAGLAQAEVRTALEDMARLAGGLESRIDVGVSQPVPDVPDLWQVQVQITASSGLEAGLRLVYAIAGHPRVFVAERFTLNRRVRRGRDEVSIDGLFSAYFRLGNPEPAQSATASATPVPSRFEWPHTIPVRDGLVPSRYVLVPSRSGSPHVSPMTPPRAMAGPIGSSPHLTSMLTGSRTDA